MRMPGIVQHLNPDGLHKNPAYTQAIVVSGNATTIYVGGQNAVEDSGNIILIHFSGTILPSVF